MHVDITSSPARKIHIGTHVTDCTSGSGIIPILPFVPLKHLAIVWLLFSANIVILIRGNLAAFREASVHLIHGSVIVNCSLSFLAFCVTRITSVSLSHIQGDQCVYSLAMKVLNLCKVGCCLPNTSN